MDPDQLRAIVSQEIAEAHGFLGGLLSDQRRLAMRYYLAKPYGNEQEDRSQVVTTEVRDIVETALPHLVNLFVASDQVVRFDPVGPGDEAVAQQATDYVNFVFMKDNPGFLTLYTLFKDALLQKNGIVKHYWEVRDRLREEEYSGLTEDELAALVTDDGVTVLEQRVSRGNAAF